MAAKKPATKKAATKRRASVGSKNDAVMRMTAAEKRKMDEENAKWQAQDDLRILRASQEIQSDPERIKRAKALIDQEMQALKSVKLKRVA